MLRLLKQPWRSGTLNFTSDGLPEGLYDYTRTADSKGTEKAHTKDYISQRVAVVTS